MKLYSYWRSTTSYRVRIALNLKGIAFDTVPIDLVQGEQRAPAYLQVNPSGGVPALELGDGTILTQSMAILEWAEEVAPKPALLPADPEQRAKVRAAALSIATDIHPVNNLRVIGKLKDLGHSQQDSVAWMQDWMVQGFEAFARLIRTETTYCFGETPGLADVCLIPQLYNAHRWGVDLTSFGRLTDIEARCLDLPTFADAHPENQIDAA